MIIRNKNYIFHILNIVILIIIIFSLFSLSDIKKNFCFSLIKYSYNLDNLEKHTHKKFKKQLINLIDKRNFNIIYYFRLSHNVVGTASNSKKCNSNVVEITKNISN